MPPSAISAARVALSPGTARESLGPGGGGYRRPARRSSSAPSYLVSSASAILNGDERQAEDDGGSTRSSSSDLSGDWSPGRDSPGCWNRGEPPAFPITLVWYSSGKVRWKPQSALPRPPMH